jgi:hypothetical protein
VLEAISHEEVLGSGGKATCIISSGTRLRYVQPQPAAVLISRMGTKIYNEEYVN